MKNHLKIFTLVILFATVLLFSFASVSATDSCTPQTYKTTDDNIQIEAKYKTASTKITFNANGGKIGTKNTLSLNIKKGASIKKFPATPKRSGHTFKGWYTKKSGGTKISVSAKPTKSIVLYAQWTKKASSKALNAAEKKLVGTWTLSWDGSSIFQFNKDGSYSQFTRFSSYDSNFKGFFSVKSGELTLKYQYRTDRGSGWGSWSHWETSTRSFTLGTDENGKQYFIRLGLRYNKV